MKKETPSLFRLSCLSRPLVISFFSQVFVVAASVMVSLPLMADPLALLNINEDETLRWRLLAPSSGEEQLVSARFGRLGDHIVFGPFRSSESSPQLGIIRDQGSEGVRWRLIDQTGEVLNQKFFGESGDFFVAGADFNNSSLIDPTTISLEAKQLLWTMIPDGLSESPGSEVRVVFGKSSALKHAFYVNFYGDGDWAGFASRSRKGRGSVLKLKNLMSGVTRKVTLKRVRRVRGRPLPMKSAAGTDVLALTQETRNGRVKVQFVKSTGKVFRRYTFEAGGTSLVGDFAPELSGEELAVQTGSELLVYNPFVREAKRYSVPSGILVDSINMNSFSDSDGGSGGGGTGGRPSGEQCTEGMPGICGCEFLDENDGYKTGFIYKRVSDTFGGIVAVLPNPCGRLTTSVVVLDGECREINELNDNGYGNPDATGDRRHFKAYDARYTGQWYQQNHGTIILKLEGTNACYLIERPSTERID